MLTVASSQSITEKQNGLILLYVKFATLAMKFPSWMEMVACWDYEL